MYCMSHLQNDVTPPSARQRIKRQNALFECQTRDSFLNVWENTDVTRKITRVFCTTRWRQSIDYREWDVAACKSKDCDGMDSHSSDVLISFCLQLMMTLSYPWRTWLWITTYNRYRQTELQVPRSRYSRNTARYICLCYSIRCRRPSWILNSANRRNFCKLLP